MQSIKKIYPALENNICIYKNIIFIYIIQLRRLIKGYPAIFLLFFVLKNNDYYFMDSQNIFFYISTLHI